MDLSKTSTACGLIITIAAVVLSFGVQLERLNRLREDVVELKQQQTEIMKAIGQLEHRQWRRDKR